MPSPFLPWLLPALLSSAFWSSPAPFLLLTCLVFCRALCPSPVAAQCCCIISWILTGCLPHHAMLDNWNSPLPLHSSASFLLGLLRASNIVRLPLLAVDGFMARSPSNAFQN
ncbi:hypothetical protein M758_UG002100 [Ceratodon purpureus]|nr:hypothetical protein M758_UG002100 [Ceratodon purpureus]